MATSLSHAYKDTHIQLDHIIPLDFGSVQDLPESHVWTQANEDPLDFGSASEPHVWTQAGEDRDHRSTCQPARMEVVPPVIDLQAPDATGLVGEACRRWGVFQVTNHEVPRGLVEEVEGHARRLFCLPADRKVKALRSPSGATGYGVARISPFFPKSMWHEGFTIMGSAAEHAKQLWPDHYQEFW